MATSTNLVFCYKGLMYAIDHLQDPQNSNELTHYQEGVVKYPGVVPSSDPSHKVKGMLFALPEEEEERREMLKKLDIYEGVVGYVSRDDMAEYERKKVTVHVPSHDTEKEQETWMYLWRLPVEKLELVKEGDYYIYNNKKNKQKTNN